MSKNLKNGHSSPLSSGNLKAVRADRPMFSDDTKMSNKISNLQDCMYLQEDIDKLKNWSKKWLLYPSMLPNLK